MEFLQRTLDDDTAAPCGRCDNCAGDWYPTEVAERAAASADASLARVGVPIEPRAQWPTGADRLGIPFKGNIPLGERADEGRALARLTDLGWGGVLRTLFDGAAADAPLTDALRDAAIRVLADWPWAQRPASIVALPSRRRPQLIDSFARSIAEAGRLPFLGSLPIRNGGPTGEAGGNSVFRLAGLWDRFDASGLEIPDGPVLLMDDLADSRWTLTVASRELRRAGATAVLPFTLALRA
jgi:ATP-dependent DNA helicase RecQ